MAQLIVTVERLNKRNAVPSSFSDKSSVIGVVLKGFRFEGEEVSNVPNAAVGKWFMDRDKSFYWAGGLMEIGQVTPVVDKDRFEAAANVNVAAGGNPIPDYFSLQFLPDQMSWGHQFLQFPALWKELNTAGKDVVVAVIDSGIDVGHPDLQDAILGESVSIDKDGNIDGKSDLSKRLMDNLGHGTQMAGIIAGRGCKLVYGIAPTCKLLVIKFTDTDSPIPVDSLTKAFDWLSSKCPVKVDIISSSLSVAEDNTDLRAAVKACIDKGIAIFSAIGNNHLADVDDDARFPACYEQCTAIGAFDSTGARCDFSNWNPSVSMLAPGDTKLLTAGLNNTTSQGGKTSIATAISAGTFALLISRLKQQQGIFYSGRALDHVDKLLLKSDPFGQPGTRDNKNGFGRLNLQRAFEGLSK